MSNKISNKRKRLNQKEKSDGVISSVHTGVKGVVQHDKFLFMFICIDPCLF